VCSSRMLRVIFLDICTDVFLLPYAVSLLQSLFLQKSCLIWENTLVQMTWYIWAYTLSKLPQNIQWDDFEGLNISKLSTLSLTLEP
jgi:hypothetical protein